jgi:mono/diheme cytochrome c family protein
MARPTGICFRWLALLALFPAPALAEAGSPARGPDSEQVARGVRLLQMQGCVSCRSLDGSPSAGPSLAGRFGTRTAVRVQLPSAGAESGQPATTSTSEVLFDRAYLIRSLAQPNLELAAGFAPGVMPAFALTEEQVDAVVAALQSLNAPAPKPVSPLGQGVAIGIALLGFALLLAWRARRRMAKAYRPTRARPRLGPQAR